MRALFCDLFVCLCLCINVWGKKVAVPFLIWKIKTSLAFFGCWKKDFFKSLFISGVLSNQFSVMSDENVNMVWHVSFQEEIQYAFAALLQYILFKHSAPSVSRFFRHLFMQLPLSRGLMLFNYFFSIRSFQLSIGQVVMANYNPDEPDERGFWYDVEITKKVWINCWIICDGLGWDGVRNTYKSSVYM